MTALGSARIPAATSITAHAQPRISLMAHEKVLTVTLDVGDGHGSVLITIRCKLEHQHCFGFLSSVEALRVHPRIRRCSTKSIAGLVAYGKPERYRALRTISAVTAQLTFDSDLSGLTGDRRGTRDLVAPSRVPGKTRQRASGVQQAMVVRSR
jgi:hypothetical protein